MTPGAQADSMFAALPAHEVALVIGGAAYTGWTELSIELALDSLAGGFSLSLTARERTGLPELPVKGGDPCQVVLGGSPLITGHVDRVDRSLEADTRSVKISGRDRAADLVDCSALNKPGSWRGATIAKIAGELAAPFGIAITVTGDPGKPLAKFALQPQETVFQAIERMARYRGLIAWSDGRGGVVIGNPDSGLRAGRIVEGGNLLSAEAGDDVSQRFSDYVIKGQASGSDERHGKVVAQVKGSARDEGVVRHRPMLIVGEEQSDPASLKKRAAWEMQTRAARGKPLTVRVPGWFADWGQANSPVWKPGARAGCEIESLGISGDRLIERVRLVREAQQGTFSELTLVPPEAWAQLPENERRGA